MTVYANGVKFYSPVNHGVENPLGEHPNWFLFSLLTKKNEPRCIGRLDGNYEKAVSYVERAMHRFALSTSGGKLIISSTEVDVLDEDSSRKWELHSFDDLENKERLKPLWVHVYIETCVHNFRSKLYGKMDWNHQFGKKTLETMMRSLYPTSHQFVITLIK